MMLVFNCYPASLVEQPLKYISYSGKTLSFKGQLLRQTVNHFSPIPFKTKAPLEEKNLLQVRICSLTAPKENIFSIHRCSL